MHTLHLMCTWWMRVTVIPDCVCPPSIWPCCCLSKRSSLFVSAWGVGALCVWVELGAGCRIIGGHCFASLLLTHVGQGPELRINQGVFAARRGHFGAFKQVSLMRWFGTSLALRRTHSSLHLAFNAKISTQELGPNLCSDSDKRQTCLIQSLMGVPTVPPTVW